MESVHYRLNNRAMYVQTMFNNNTNDTFGTQKASIKRSLK